MQCKSNVCTMYDWMQWTEKHASHHGHGFFILQDISDFRLNATIIYWWCLQTLRNINLSYGSTTQTQEKTRLTPGLIDHDILWMWSCIDEKDRGTISNPTDESHSPSSYMDFFIPIGTTCIHLSTIQSQSWFQTDLKTSPMRLHDLFISRHRIYWNTHMSVWSAHMCFCPVSNSTLTPN